MKRAIFAAALALSATGLAACATSTGSSTYVIPSQIPADCSVDVGSPLNQLLAAMPSGTAAQPLDVELPSHACYLVSGAVLLQDHSYINIHGNGSTIQEATIPSGTTTPIADVWHDDHINVTGLTLNGTNNGSNGGGGTEGDYGVELQGSSNISFVFDSIKNTQGDWVYLAPPNNVDTVTDALNTNVTFDAIAFLNAGYHGLTVESANGLLVENSTMTNTGVDAMDFEYDTYSTPFNPDGTPYWAAQDNVTITNNTWTNWQGDWFASIQGQVPGVQEQNLSITNNTLNGTGPFMEVNGTDANSTTPQYLDSGWTITGNHYASGFYIKPYHGAGSANTYLQGVYGLTMSNNGLPECPSQFENPQPSSLCTNPTSNYAIQAYGLTGVVENNDMTGTLGVIEPDSNGVVATICGNTIGPWTSTSIDATC